MKRIDNRRDKKDNFLKQGGLGKDKEGNAQERGPER